MFFHIFKYNIRQLLREKTGLFWTLVFPLLLSTLFRLAFSNLNETAFFEKISVAVVSSAQADTVFLEAMASSELFDMQETDIVKADELLTKGDITGYITFAAEPQLIVGKSGMNESMLKTFMDTYAQRTSTMEQVYRNNPQGLTQAFLDKLSAETSYTEAQPVSKSSNSMVIYYYALLAMTVLMMATYGCGVIMEIQANQSARAARVSVAPTHKMKIFLASVSATFITQLVCILIVLAYQILVLGVDFGASLGKVVLLCLVGCIMSITFGTALGAVFPKSEYLKTGVVVAITMLESFLAGLMAVEVKYFVQKALPIMGYLNPAALITDALYALFYYDTFERYYISLGILGVMAAVCCAVTYSVLRRQKYASI